jgi:GT2 family glycosyltransferase
VVNYNSGAFAISCVESLLADWEREGRARDDLQIVVVDNASPADQTEALARIEGLGAKVVRSETNGGYAAGMNLAYAESTGGPRDVVGILNPDLFFLPGSIGVLLDYLAEHPECGACDPRASMDPLGTINLPRNLLPTIGDHFGAVLAHMFPSRCRAYSRRRYRANLPYWNVTGPTETDMLSGCCVLLRREVAEQMPDLMDGRFPLYYEDTDLFRTVRKRGYRLIHHGGARILHHWSRSAGVGGQFQDEPLRRYRISQRRYFEKWYGKAGRMAVDVLNKIEEAWPDARSHRPMHEMTHLGHFAEPATIPLPHACRFVLELTMAPTFVVAGGIFGEGDSWTFPAETWPWLFQADYFLRGFDLGTGEFLGAWQLAKTVEGRETPFRVEELAEYGDRIFGGKAS